VWSMKLFERGIKNAFSIESHYLGMSIQYLVVLEDFFQMSITMQKHSVIGPLSKGMHELIDSAYVKDTFYI